MNYRENLGSSFWLIIDDNLFLCGHSFKDMGKKLTAIILMETKPDVVIGAVK